jgi:CRISPR-associated protein Csm4
VSDAFPGDLLPSPAHLPLLPGLRAQDGKKLRTDWLTADEFRSVQRGTVPPSFGQERRVPYREVVRLRNSIDRAVNSTGESGELYEAAGELLATADTLAIFARVAEHRLDWAASLFALLAETGYGADVAVGAGEVELAGPPEVVSDFEPMVDANGWVSLSTFQPAKDDPTDGCWRSFVKYGKLGPDIATTSVFKRPQWMLRAGACFRTTGPRRDWYGHWIGTKELLTDRTCRELKTSGVLPGQPAYALALPLHWVGER